MPSIKDSDFFRKSYNNSLGSLFKDFYSSEELSILEKELRNHYTAFPESEVEIEVYVPNPNDPLLRMQHHIVLISCKSLPFFASRIRKAFHLLHWEVNRILHFHPQEGSELYYIEIIQGSFEHLKKLSDGLKSSYFKIQELTQSFTQFRKDRSAEWLQWDVEFLELQNWLLDKSYVWEASIFVQNGSTQKFGNLDLPEEIENWFQNLSTNKGEKSIEAMESNIRSFLGDGRYFYIAFLENDKKLLMVGSLNQFAEAAALVDIPYFRNRFFSFMEKEKIEKFSGLGRTTRMLFNYIPTEILFMLKEDSYTKIHSAILEHSLRSQIRSVGVSLSEGVGIIISFVPEESWSELVWEKTDSILESIYSGGSIRKYFVMRSNFIEAFHLIRHDEIKFQNLFEASSRVEFSFKSWMDHLESKWDLKTPFLESYLEFHEDYKATHNTEQCLIDLKNVQKLDEYPLVVEITHKHDTTILHVVTTKMKFLLSQWVKVLSDLGFSPISQRVYHFQFKGVTYAKSEFFFHYIENENDLYTRWKNVFYYTMTGKIRSDSLSGLIQKTNLDENGLLFAKAIRDYCLQTNSSFNLEELNQYLIFHSSLVQASWEYFTSVFHDGKNGNSELLEAEADKGHTIREDDALHAFSTSVIAILRTDFFGIHSDRKLGIERDFVSFKIDSSIPSSLPEPRPYRESFIYSTNFQGIHLRGGAVARGGIRWSDRVSDYRTELLSLLKTQMVKNSIIVPVGSKGSFVLTPNPLLNIDINMKEAYSYYISGLLGLVDNRKKGEIIAFDSKNGSVPYALDPPDPYLVVAADKGTAQLSDTANSLSERFDYWLRDAFASGGSRGYSHKSYGITARGALVTADRNFRMLSVDFRAETITVVGIGDMGGDVFGNGLLESEHFALLAAFNHKHIFLDPNPNPTESYKERQRLFIAKDSGWDFYNPSLISQGGGVFNRTEKTILISKEVKKALSIEATHLSGSELIQAILTAKVDLLYNGGIGTYVKASSEENAKVGDPANNDVRVDGAKLRSKVVSEGGNLGFTQKARIEYDQKGGFIFTDAIDNSAGVDLSDHEVNLKIFMNELLESGKIQDLDERDRILKEVDQDVVQSVLLDNELQSLAINVDRFESERDGWQEFQDVSAKMILRGVLEPGLNQIPRLDEDWKEWKNLSIGLPRPALAVLLGHTKMELYTICLEGGAFQPDDFPHLYLGYFPKKIVQDYRNEVLNHPLKLEICTTRAVNFLVNLLGSKINSLLPSSNSEKILILQKILLSLEEIHLSETLNSLSLIRDKRKEKEILELISRIRSTIRMKWMNTNRDEVSWKEPWYGILPENELKNLEILFA